MKKQEDPKTIWAAFLAKIEENAKAAGMSVQEYRLSTLYLIVDERSNKVVRFKPNPIQRLFLRTFWYLTFVLKARQHGMSTLMAIMQLDACLFSNNYRAAIVDRTDAEAKKKLAKMRFAYDHLGEDDNGNPFPAGQFLQQQIKLVAPTNDHAMTFSNGSNVIAATTHRGSTANFLWISEFGYIASEDPSRAGEIVSGSINTVHPGNLVFLETTHEGGRYGLSYELIRAAQANKEPLTQMQMRLLFFGWWQNPEYSLDVPHGTVLRISDQNARYFQHLERETGVKLTDAQKNWYVQKAAFPGVDMARQYPGTVEEALSAQTEGAIYGDIIAILRAKNRIKNIVPDGHNPLFAFWDLGMSDFTSVWLLQFVGQDVIALDYHTATGYTPAQHAAKMLMWEREYRPISMHFMPHDANNRGIEGKTYVNLMNMAGITNIKVVPRTPDIWVGINALRGYLPSFFFNAGRCEREFKQEGVRAILPSGLAALEGYRKKLEASGGTLKEQPIHDESSHGADALRTYAEARQRGMLNNIQALAGFQDKTKQLTVSRDSKRQLVVNR